MLVTPHLFIPGPTNIPEAVRTAMDIRMEDMRIARVPEVHAADLRGPEEGLQDEGRPRFHFPVVGHRRLGSRRSPTRSTVGDKVLMSRFGQFSLLWVDMAERLGLKVEVLRRRVGHGRAGREVRRHPRQG